LLAAVLLAGKDEPPVADAGPDQTIQLPADSAVLSGDRSATLLLKKNFLLKGMACHVLKMRIHSAKIALHHYNQNNSAITV